MKDAIAVLIAVVALQVAPAAQATLLVYEPFDYSTGTASGSGVLLAGQAGGTGMTGAWSTLTTGQVGNNAATVYQEGNLSGVNLSSANGANGFKGEVANLPTSGGYAGAISSLGVETATTTDHMMAWRPLDPSVTATFVDGSTTWFSYVSHRAFNANATSPSLAIGAAELVEDRGNTALGEAIGAGGNHPNASGSINTLAVMPKYWDQTLSSPGETGGNFAVRNSEGGNANNVPPAGFMPWAVTTTDLLSVPNIIIGKIEWHDGTPDVISVVRFLETDVLSEAAFDAAILAQPLLSSANWVNQVEPDLDQSAFDMISLGGGKYFADEIRIATTFDEAVGLSIQAEVPAPAALPAGLLAMAMMITRRRRA